MSRVTQASEAEYAVGFILVAPLFNLPSCVELAQVRESQNSKQVFKLWLGFNSSSMYNSSVTYHAIESSIQEKKHSIKTMHAPH